MHSSDTTDTTLPSRRLVCCAVQNEEYCFDLADVQSITRAHQMTPAVQQQESASAETLLGWVTTDRLPVYDLAHQLQLAPKPAPQAALQGFVVTLRANEPYALRVDRITGNIDILPSQMTALPPVLTAGEDPIFKGIAQLEEKWLLCADAQQLHPHSTALPPPMPKPVATTPTISARPVASTSGKRAAPKIMIFLPATNSAPGEAGMPLAFGLSIRQVQEVTKVTSLIPIPKAPPYVLGLTNWRNLPVPVIDLSLRLGLSTTPIQSKLIDPLSRLLIARAPQQGELIGVLVHPQVKIFHLPIPYQTRQEPLAVSSDLVKGVFELEETPFVIPDLDMMLRGNFASTAS